MVSDGLQEDVSRWGNRTSSFLSSYRHFQSHKLPTGCIRMVQVPGALVAAGEPLCPPAERCDAFFDASATARASNRRLVMMPVGAELAEQVRTKGGHSLCVGSEPILELETWLDAADPYDRLPVARAVARRGGRVEEWPSAQLSNEQRTVIERLTEAWRERRDGPMVGFLNVATPLEGVEHKAVFAAFDGKLKEPAAILAAVPVASDDGDGRIIAWFFADYFRHPEARAGTIEFLFVEAARALRARGAREIRLGLCPLAHLDRGVSDGVWERLLRPFLSRYHGRASYPFRYASVTAFKNKLGPSRWERLYLLTDQARGPGLTRALAWAHFPEGPFRARTTRLREGLAKHVVPTVLPMLRPAPRGYGDAVRAGAIVLALAAICATLHVGRALHPALQQLFESSRFIPGEWSLPGVFLGPLFHNHTYHLSGDLLSLLFFGLLLEWSTGHRLVAAVVAFGLWSTNPISTWLVAPLLARFSPDDLQAFLQEGDVGSSNAVYAIVGACAVGLRKPWLLLLPFALNGVYLCVVKYSWLSIHHLVGLAGGFAAGWIWRAIQAQKATSPTRPA
jgi:hypothetical protein